MTLATMFGNRAAFGQNAKSKRLIGVLMGATNDAEAAVRGSVFEDALRKLGWRTGENVSIEYRFAAGDPNLVRSHSAELVAMKPDVILGDGTSATVSLREATRTIPVIFVQVTDPVGTGLVSSLARPGGNVTGIQHGWEVARHHSADKPGRETGRRALQSASRPIWKAVRASCQ